MTRFHAISRGAALLAVLCSVVPDQLASQASPGEAGSMTTMLQATVKVMCLDTGGWGSGVVVGRGNSVVTNNHVLAGCNAAAPDSTVIVRAYNGEARTAHVLVTDPIKDVAILRIDGVLGASPVSLRSEATVTPGQFVWVLGYPGVAENGRSGINEARATFGPVSRAALPDRNGQRFLIDHSAGAYPGNSGGPLFDACGTVIGIHTQGVNNESGSRVGTVGFAVGARSIKEVAARAGVELDVPVSACGTNGLGALVAQAVTAAAPAPATAAPATAAPAAAAPTTSGTPAAAPTTGAPAVAAPAVTGPAAATTPAMPPQAAAAVARLAASYAAYSKKYEARFTALQGAIATGDSVALEQADKKVAALGELLNAVKGDMIGMQDAQDKAIRLIESMDATFRREQQMQWVGIGLALLLGVGAVGFTLRTRAAVGTVAQDVAKVGGAVAEVTVRLDELEASLKLERERHFKELERLDAGGAADARDVGAMLQRQGELSSEDLSASARTNIVRTLAGQRGGPVLGGLAANVDVRDAMGASRRATLEPGRALFIGRNRKTMETVAKGFVFQPEFMELAQRPNENIVSRVHCLVVNDGFDVHVIDASANGTFVLAPETPSIRRSTEVPADARRNKSNLLEKGDRMNIDRAAHLSLVRPDSGYDVRVSVTGNAETPTDIVSTKWK